jgi:hypothetical protein
LLNQSPSLGFNDDNEDESPCGGFTPVLNSSVAQVQVDGFLIALRSTHPEVDWHFPFTLSLQEPFNWMNLLPVVHKVGLGDFCVPDFKVPAEFAGQSGLLQVLQDAVDGELYQVRSQRIFFPTLKVSGLTCIHHSALPSASSPERTVL